MTTDQQTILEGNKVFDTKTGKEETVLETTFNSYLVTQSKLTEQGINCNNWFAEKDFKARFSNKTSSNGK